MYKSVPGDLKRAAVEQGKSKRGVLIPENVSAAMLKEWTQGRVFAIEWHAEYAIIRRDGVEWMTLPIL